MSRGAKASALKRGLIVEGYVAYALNNAPALARAAIAYDEAIQRCAANPRKMSSYCTANGETLDSLYAEFIGLARKIESAIRTPKRADGRRGAGGRVRRKYE